MSGIAVITGAATGIGFELAKCCGQDGYDLLLIDIDIEKLRSAAKSLRELYHTNVQLLSLDLSEESASEHIYHSLNAQEVEILINNAGFGVIGVFSNTDWRKEHAMIRLHIITLTNLTKLILKDMIVRKDGYILNVASIAAYYPGPLMAVYYATKAYILSFSQAIGNEVKADGVTVTTLCPGLVKTNFQSSAESKQHIVSKWHLLTDPEKVAEYGYRAMLRGKSVAIPGLLPKIMVLLQRFLPGKWVAMIVGSLQRLNQSRASTASSGYRV